MRKNRIGIAKRWRSFSSLQNSRTKKTTICQVKDNGYRRGNMVNPTKNIQSKKTLNQLISCAFPNRSCVGISELTEGLFNVAYEIKFRDGKESILKIAPSPEITVMTYERNIMEAEVSAMKLIAERVDIPVSKVEYYDSSCTICNAPYFFMEKLKGKSLFSLKSILSNEEKKMFNKKVGSLNQKINQVTNKKFGYLGQKELQGVDWYKVFRNMLKAVFKNAHDISLDLKIPYKQLLTLLEVDKPIFDEVKTPRLVHWDLWDGNIFIENGQVTGLIDWERSLWGDPLMEVGFRSYFQNVEFIEGYGLDGFTPEEQRRILWYDVYLLLIVAQEHIYRKYESTDSYEWATGLLKKKFPELLR